MKYLLDQLVASLVFVTVIALLAMGIYHAQGCFQ